MTATPGVTQRLVFVVPGPPVPKARARTVRGHTYTPARTVEAEKRIASYFKVRYPNHVPLTSRLRVVLRFYLKGVRGDSDNFCKTVLDALNKRAWVDDKQIDAIDLTVIRSSPNPHTEIEVWQ